MGVLEQVTQMKQQGMSEQDIAATLQQEGVTPKEITDALSRSQIKSAISDTGPDINPPTLSAQRQTNERPYTPSTQEIGNDPNMYQEYASQDVYGQEGYPQESYPQDQYPQDPYVDYMPGATDTNTMIEIANQVFLDKISHLNKKISELNEFKNIAETKINHATERLKKIENTIDKLQIAILDKVGS
ncbi:MAG: hypothetical protein ABIB47_02255, partial [Candidatus Woesearchaeota archaeon]